MRHKTIKCGARCLCSMHGENRDANRCITHFFGNHHTVWLSVKLRITEENNIKMDLRKIGYLNTNWIALDYERTRTLSWHGAYLTTLTRFSGVVLV